MHIETSADARQSRRHAAGGGLAGPAADDRGYLAAAASRFSSWWSGERRSPALTADADSGAGLQGGTTDSDPPSNGDAAPAPPEGGEPPSQSNRGPLALGGSGAGEGGTRFGVHALLGAGTPRAWAQGRAVEEPN